MCTHPAPDSVENLVILGDVAVDHTKLLWLAHCGDASLNLWINQKKKRPDGREGGKGMGEGMEGWKGRMEGWKGRVRLFGAFRCQKRKLVLLSFHFWQRAKKFASLEFRLSYNVHTAFILAENKPWLSKPGSSKACANQTPRRASERARR